MIKRIYLALALLFCTNVCAMDVDKTTTSSHKKITLHFKNDDIGYPSNSDSNSFSIKQADYISTTGRDFFVFPQFKGPRSGLVGLDKRYVLNDITIVASLSFSDGSVVGKSASLPSIGQSTNIVIPYENENQLQSINYSIQGKGYYNCRFDSTGQLVPCSDMYCETLGSAWIVPWSNWNFQDNYYAYIKYPYANETKDTFRTFFGMRFK